MVINMKKTLLTLLIASSLIPSISFAQTTDTNCEFECKNEHRSAKFECSKNWSGPEQESNKQNCLDDARNSYQQCMNTCISE